MTDELLKQSLSVASADPVEKSRKFMQEAGYTVRGLTRSESKAPVLDKKGIEPIVGDVNDGNLMAKAVTGVSAIVHTASLNAPAPGESKVRTILWSLM